MSTLRLRQVALVATDLAPVVDALHDQLGLVVAPTRAGTAAGRRPSAWAARAATW